MRMEFSHKPTTNHLVTYIELCSDPNLKAEEQNQDGQCTNFQNCHKQCATDRVAQTLEIYSLMVMEAKSHVLCEGSSSVHSMPLSQFWWCWTIHGILSLQFLPSSLYAILYSCVYTSSIFIRKISYWIKAHFIPL